MPDTKIQPLVSVIVPAFNAEAFIEETLKSVLSQTYSNLEVIVVDDGSKDCTAKVVEAVCKADSRVKLFKRKNRGVAAARNFAIENSKGEFVAPVDADDIWYPTKIQRQVERLQEAGAKAGLAYTWSVSIDEKGRLMDAGPMWDLEGEVYAPLVLRNFIGNASVPLFRRAALDRAGGYNEDLRTRDAQGCEDWDLSLRVAEYFSFCAVKDYLVGYRCYSQSMSYNHGAMGRSYELVMDEVQRRHPEIPARVFRWSRSNFYLYLTNKSNVSGDIPNSLQWLVKAIRLDPAVLFVPWAMRCLLNRLLRTVAFKITGSHRAWRTFRKNSGSTASTLSYEELVEESRRRRARRLWERIQVHRWALTNNHRSSSC